MTTPERSARGDRCEGRPVQGRPTRDLPEASREARLPAGFRVAAARAGIKASGGLDLAVVVVDGPPAAVAATFTTNRLPAAPVRLNREHLAATDPDGAGRRGWAQAMMSTSGCANAATGEAGLADQRRLASCLAAAVGTDVHLVLAMSTGLIGSRLPVERVEAAIGTVVAGELRAEGAAFMAVGEALRTTDSQAKSAAVTVGLPGPDGTTVPVTVSGVAKGVGMNPPQHGHDALFPAHGRGRLAGAPGVTAAAGRGAHLGPGQRGR